MGNGMNKVMPGLYIGNYRDSKDFQQLDRHGITHIVSIHDSPRRFHPDKHYLCVIAADKPDQNLSQYFSVCNDFIHSARLKQGNVLIHCLAGMSRSVTVAVAYIMAVTPLSWKEALKVVRAGRSIANPNLGFQNQLQEFETNKLLEERKRLKERFPSLALESSDREQCYLSLDYYEELLESKGVCEGHCKFGKDCPTGICRQDSRGGGAGGGWGSGGRVNRKSSLSSKKQYNTSLSTSPSSSSQLSVRSVGSPGGAQSCPTSPRCAKASAQRRSTGEPGSGTAGNRNPDNPRAAGEYAAEIDIGELSELRRSSSIVSTYRPRSSPAGLYSYTGSAPPSIHGSRVDLSGGVSGGTGSAIYLGSSSGSGGSGGAGAGSSPGPCRRLSMRSTPKSTPESSPKASPKKSATTPGKMAASASSKKTATTGNPPNIGRKGSSSVSGASPSSSTSSSSNGASSSPAPAITSAQPAKKEANATGKSNSKTTVPSNNNTVMIPGTTTTSTDAGTTSTTTTTTTTATSAASTAKTTTTTSAGRRSEVPTTRTPSIVIDISANRPDCVTASSGKAKKDMKDGFSSKDAVVEGVGNTNRNSETTVTRQAVTSNNASNRVPRKE